jgi:hypothetical protein
MGPTTELRRALKNRFFTHAETHGFTIDKRHQPVSTVFRRRIGTSVHILELQWDKYGRRRFRLHFGACPAAGLEVDGLTILPDEALPAWCALNGTLRPRPGMTGGTFFRQDSSWLERLRGHPPLREPDVVVNRLLAHFPEIERFFENGAVGPHLKIWPSRTG